MIPAELLAEYEPLREHLGGIGAARLERGMCSGLSAEACPPKKSIGSTKLQTAARFPLRAMREDSCSDPLTPLRQREMRGRSTA